MDSFRLEQTFNVTRCNHQLDLWSPITKSCPIVPLEPLFMYITWSLPVLKDIDNFRENYGKEVLASAVETLLLTWGHP